MECEREKSRRDPVDFWFESIHSSTFPSSILLRKGHEVGLKGETTVDDSNQEKRTREIGQTKRKAGVGRREKKSLAGLVIQANSRFIREYERNQAN